MKIVHRNKLYKVISTDYANHCYWFAKNGIAKSVSFFKVITV